MPVRSAFTLIELLVVITIIVILIAMLSPALEKSIREAEMAACAARQKAIVSAGSIYAQDHRRAYPQPRVARQDGTDAEGNVAWLETTSSTYQPDLIGVGTDPDRDLRPLYEPYMPYETYGCPLAPGIRFDSDSNADSSAVFSSYSILMGWQYARYDHFSNETGNTIVDQRESWRGMRRFGDRLGFYDNWNDRTVETDVAVLDRNHTHSWGPHNAFGGQAAHPDDEGLWSFFIWDNTADLTHTVFGYGYRGTLDINTARTDHSVARTNDLARIDGVTSVDDRFVYAPAHADTTNFPQYRLMIPR